MHHQAKTRSVPEMVWNILKKDLKRKKAMNGILFLFITLCTVFLASSISNFIVTTNALDYFEEATRLSDYIISATDDELTQWLEDNPHVTHFEVQQIVQTTNEAISRITAQNDGEQRLLELAIGGQTPLLSTLPQDLIVPLDLQNQRITPINPGEIVLNYQVAHLNQIAVGDVVHIEIDATVHTFEVTQLAKEIFQPRFFISDEDFAYLFTDLPNAIYSYAINISDLAQFTRTLNLAEFPNLARTSGTMFRNLFMIDLMVMIVLVVIGASLIALSFVVLRFVIVFTLQEDFKEIGIMKAIGLKNGKIKNLYLIKYLFLATVGASLGFLLSGPFSALLTAGLRRRIAFPETGVVIWIRLVSTIVVVILILLFCLMSTKKLNRFTAISAIRNGETGERFNRKSILHLHRMKKMPSVVYLAFNDILSNKKSYLTLLIVFILGFLLTLIPLNASHTMNPSTFVEMFGLRSTDFYLADFTFNTNPFEGTVADFNRELESIEQTVQTDGLNIQLSARIAFEGMIYTDDIKDAVNIGAITQLVNDPEPFSVRRGFAPTLDNEVAVSEILLNELNFEIGDEINLLFGGVSHTFIIVGSYDSMMNMGRNIRLSDTFIAPDTALFRINPVLGNFVNSENENADDLRQQLASMGDDWEVLTVDEMLARMLMDTSIVETISNLFLIVVMLVNVLITALMCLSFLLKDVKQIALLKSLGFSNRALKTWQSLRILIVMTAALIVGLMLVPLANTLTGIPFALMGGPNVTITMNVTQVYLLYPLIFLAVCALTLMATTAGIKKIGLTDLGQAD